MKFLLTYLIGVSWFTGGETVEPMEWPASTYYQTFDTNNVHYWVWNSPSVADTVTLHLFYDISCDYHHPVNNIVTSHYGKRRRRMHYGTDIDCETGDPIGAAFEGMVRIAKWSNSYGNIVVIRHPNGLETYYAHLSALKVVPGQYVQPGDIVGLGGNTGRSYGSHLHFEMRFMGLPINPEVLVDFNKKTLKYTDIQVYRKGDELVIRNAAKFYTVQPGDDMFSIAERLGMDVGTLCSLNGLEEDALLLVDSKVRYE